MGSLNLETQFEEEEEEEEEEMVKKMGKLRRPIYWHGPWAPINIIK